MEGQMDGQTDGETTTTATLNAAAYREGRTFDHSKRKVCEVCDRQADRQIPQKHIHFRW